MLWTTIFKIKWTGDRVLFGAGFITALFLIRIGYKYSTSLLSKRDREKQISKENYPQEKNTRRKSLGATTALLSIFIFSLAIRLIMIRDLATPAWVDSVHHALITRIILENGSYPSTYLPYWDIYPTAYHPGFHSIVATFTWMTNLNIAKALLLLGQFLNALCIFSVYLLTTSLTKNTKAGLFAALITGCLTPMPAYYTSWGRYTQLAGLLILPVIIALLRLIQEEKIRRKLLWVMLIGSISAGGLFLVHYRVIVFLFCLLLSYFLFQSLTLRKYKLYIPFRFIIIISAIAILAILIISPWFLPTVKNTLLPALTAISDGSVSFFHDFSWQYLTSALGKQAIAFAGLGLIWGMINRKKFTLTLIFWIFLLFLIANFDALKLPGGGLINNTSVEIILFIPISILGGYFIAQMIASWTFLINKRWLIILFTLIIIPTSAIAYTGAKQLIPIINPVTILSRNADLPAIDWIGKHVPADEVIVINPFPWGYGLYAGNDGGYWISPLSGRMTLPPPILYGLESRRSNINEASQEVITLGNDSLGLWEYLKSQNLNYVFIGAKGGAIAPQALANSGLFTVLYHEDGVWILNRKP
jgi:hypothetical protein